MSKVAFSQNITLWGTGLDEHRIGIQAMEEQLQRDWSQSTRSTLEPLSFFHHQKMLFGQVNIVAIEN